MATASSFTWKEDCKNLLDILNREEDSEHFREPVNLLLYTNYFKYVDHPMDLQTVGENLKANNYATLSDSPRTSVSSWKIPRNSTKQKKGRFTDRLIDSRIYLKITSVSFWLPVPTKHRVKQLDVSLKCSC